MDTETPTERAAVITLAIAGGHGLTTRQTAEITGLTMQGAYVLLCRISRVVPIYQDGEGKWRLLDSDPAC